MDQPQYPFARNEIFRSRDLDEVREGMARVMCPHVLKVLGAGCRLDALMTSMPLDSLVVSYVHYGASVHVEPGCTDSFLAVQVPIIGRSTILNGSVVVDSSPRTVLVSRPHESLSMDLSHETRLLLTKVPRPFVRQKLSDLLGGLVPEEVRFEPGMDVTEGLKKRWLDHFLDHVRHPHLFHRRLYVPLFEERFMIGLLIAQENNYSDVLRNPPFAAGRAQRREALDLLQDTPEWPHTAGTVARHVDVSLRALQAAFRNEFGVSVNAYLAGVRLRRAREELLTAAPYEVTVRDIAGRWGFVEPDFSLRYIATYAEWPLDTLERS